MDVSQVNEPQKNCPRCGTPVGPDDVRCGRCGADLRMATGMDAAAGARKAGNVAPALAVSVVAAVIGGIAWAAIASLIGNEVGFLACGVGLLAGGGATLCTRERSTRIGIAAAGCAILGLLCGKFLMFEWGAVRVATKELSKNERFVAVVVLFETLQEEKHTLGEAAQEIDLSPADLASEERAEKIEHLVQQLTPEQEERLLKKANERLAKLTDSGREALVRKYVEHIVARISLSDRFRTMFSVWAIIWFALATGIAWKMGAGPGRAADTQIA